MSESISDVRFRELRDAGYTGSISDMERQRLLSVLSLAEPMNLSLSDLYNAAGEVPWPFNGFSPVGPPAPVGPPVAGYAAWYDFSDLASLTLTGSVIDAAADKSGNGFNLVKSGAGGPTSVLSTTLGANTLKHARFDSVDGKMLTIASDLGITGSYTVIVAARKQTSGQVGGNADPLITLRGHSSYISTASLTIWLGAAPSIVTGVSTEWQPARAHTRIVSGTSHSYWINDTQYISSVVGSVGEAGSLMVGGDVANGADWDIGELVIYASALSAGDRASVVTYLNNKWTLT